MSSNPRIDARVEVVTPPPPRVATPKPEWATEIIRLLAKLDERVDGLALEMRAHKREHEEREEMPSGHDLRTQADLAKEIVARQAADEETARLQREDRERLARIESETKLQTKALDGLTKLTKDPRVIIIALALSKLAHDWAAAHHLLP